MQVAIDTKSSTFFNLNQVHLIVNILNSINYFTTSFYTIILLI